MIWDAFLPRVVLALVLGALIGVERQWRQRMAGLRTNALVATGARHAIRNGACRRPIGLSNFSIELLTLRLHRKRAYSVVTVSQIGRASCRERV